MTELAVNMQLMVLLERMEEQTRTTTRNRQTPDYLQDLDCSSIQFGIEEKKEKWSCEVMSVQPTQNEIVTHQIISKIKISNI